MALPSRPWRVCKKCSKLSAYCPATSRRTAKWTVPSFTGSVGRDAALTCEIVRSCCSGLGGSVADSVGGLALGGSVAASSAWSGVTSGWLGGFFMFNTPHGRRIERSSVANRWAAKFFQLLAARVPGGGAEDGGGFPCSSASMPVMTWAQRAMRSGALARRGIFQSWLFAGQRDRTVSTEGHLADQAWIKKDAPDRLSGGRLPQPCQVVVTCRQRDLPIVPPWPRSLPCPAVGRRSDVLACRGCPTAAPWVKVGGQRGLAIGA